MARFLLGTQTFVDLAKTDESQPRKWLDNAYDTRGVIDTDTAISSATSVSVHRHFLDLQARGEMDARLLTLQTRCARYEQAFRERGNILPIDDDVVLAWKQNARLDLRYVGPDGKPYTIGLEEQLLIATAIARRLTLLNRRQPAHQDLAFLGLLVEDPYEPSAVSTPTARSIRSCRLRSFASWRCPAAGIAACSPPRSSPVSSRTASARFVISWTS